VAKPPRRSRQPVKAPQAKPASPVRYTIVTKPAFDRAFDKLTKKNKQLAEQLRDAIDGLERNPRPNGVKKLVDWAVEGESVHRIVSGSYRILYIIRDKVLVVVLVDVDDRKDAYK
jgi:mRNA interferase RelE/StbE